MTCQEQWTKVWHVIQVDPYYKLYLNQMNFDFESLHDICGSQIVRFDGPQIPPIQGVV